MGAFLGYAAYYLVRKNLSLAAPGMIEDGLVDKTGVGFAMSAVSIAYAFSKFIMGSVSDRSDARKFLVVGLVLSALTMMSVGLIPFGANQLLNVSVIFVLMLVLDGSPAWDGLHVVVSWHTGSHRMKEASRCQYGIHRILLAEDHSVFLYLWEL